MEYHTTHQPRTESVGYGPWTAILTALFLLPKEDEKESRLPDFAIEVSKIVQPGDLQLQIVLIVEIKNGHHWPDGAERLSDCNQDAVLDWRNRSTLAIW